MVMIMGIDPGLKGGVAFYDGDTLSVYATPVLSETFIKKGKTSKRNIMDLSTMSDIIKQHNPTHGFLEKVSAMPGQGVTGMFRFGTNYGEYRGIMAGLGVSWTEVLPQKWKKAYALSSDKNPSLILARELFPDNINDFRLIKHDGLAEAALIAKFGFDNPSLLE